MVTTTLTKILPQFWVRLMLIGWGLGVASIALPGVAIASVQTDASPIQFIQQANSVPPRRGTPPTREGTGSRGDCLYKPGMPPLTRMVGSDPLSLTVSDHPTIWVYLPYGAQESPFGEFSVQEGENDLYRVRFPLPVEPGIISLTVPPNVLPLQVGKTYRWYVDVNCPSATAPEGSTPASLTGIVRRVAPAPALLNELQAAKTPLQKAAAYARHGIWHETITTLGNLRQREPRNPNLESIWLGLLSDQKIGLAEVAKAPIASPTTSSQPK